MKKEKLIGVTVRLITPCHLTALKIRKRKTIWDSLFLSRMSQ